MAGEATGDHPAAARARGRPAVPVRRRVAGLLRHHDGRSRARAAGPAGRGAARPRARRGRRGPTGAARSSVGQRPAAGPVTPWAPTVLAEGYELVRVRAGKGRWLDAYRTNNETAAVIKLLDQPAVSFLTDANEGATIPL